MGFNSLKASATSKRKFTTKFPDTLVLILSTSGGWKTESTLKPPNGFEYATPWLEIQRLNH